MSDTRTTYRFAPLERHGLLGPIRAGQAITVAVTVVFAIVVIDRLPSVGGFLVAISIVTGTTTLVTAPIAGRTADQWLPVALAHLLRRLGHGAEHRASAPSRGVTWRPASRLSPALELPRTLADIRLTEIEHRGLSIGVVSELGGRRLTAALACRVEAFALLDAGAQERRLAHWGTLLATAAGTAIRRLQWIERTAPAQTDELARWLNTARDPSIPPRGASIVESYIDLIGSGTRVTHAHEVLLVLQVDGGLTRARGRAAQAARTALIEQLEWFARGLEAAEVRVLGALGAGQLAHTLRTAFDPYARAELSLLAAAERDPGDARIRAAGRRDVRITAAAPLGTLERWDHYRCDGALHASYWISAWPRTEVIATFLDPLLGNSQTVRTISVVFEPVTPERSTRDVEAALTRDRADSELRRRFGQAETARLRQVREAARRREEELAAGHAEVRLAGFVTVSGRDEDELRHACGELSQQAARARLELRRMYGQQAEAFTFTLPLARGLR